MAFRSAVTSSGSPNAVSLSGKMEEIGKDHGMERVYGMKGKNSQFSVTPPALVPPPFIFPLPVVFVYDPSPVIVAVFLSSVAVLLVATAIAAAGRK